MQNLKVNTTVLSGTKEPSTISPSTTIKRNTERSLDGTLNVDIVYEKATVDIAWDFLDNNDFETILNLFPKDTTIQVSLFENTAREYYVESISYSPFYLNDELCWQNLQISITEI